MTNAFQLRFSSEGIAELTFNLPNEKVNTFSLPILEELEAKIEALASDSTIKALKFVSGKTDSFIAGADLHCIQSGFDKPEMVEKLITTGHRVFTKIQNLPFPTIAIIHGYCLGGGLECALSCTYRIVSDHSKTQLGLPETTVGLIPGWGGTQRLPRLVGLLEGITLIITGKTISAKKAWEIHLADLIVPWELLPSKSDDFVRAILIQGGKSLVEKHRQEKKFFNWCLESNPPGRALLFSKVKKLLEEKNEGYYPAPLIALDVIRRTHALPLAEGLKTEEQEFISQMSSGFHAAKNLIPLFFIKETAKKVPGVPKDVTPKETHPVAIIGTEALSSDLAWLCADNYILTFLNDTSNECVQKGLAAAKAYLDKKLQTKAMSPSDYQRCRILLNGTTDSSHLKDANIVIDTTTQDLKEVETVVRPETLIATTASSSTIAEMSQGMQHPERFIGLHFSLPAYKMSLVEVVPGKHTSPQTIATAVSLCKILGKTPILVGDCPGFLVDRILKKGAEEIVHMMEEGYSRDSINEILGIFGIIVKPKSRVKLARNTDDILPRFLYIMINEAAKCLKEKIVSQPELLDLAVIMGMPFPSFTGGLLRYADSIGLNNIVDKLNEFQQRLGIRFKPCNLLQQKAREHTKFY